MISRHAFAGNPILRQKRESVTVTDLGEAESAGALRVIPLLEGKPLVASISTPQGTQIWRLAWQSFGACHNALLSSQQALNAFHAEQKAIHDGEGHEDDDDEENSNFVDISHDLVTHDRLVYLGDADNVSFCALDVSPYPPFVGAADKIAQDTKWLQGMSKSWEPPSLEAKVGFVDLRLLMTGTDYLDEATMNELSIAGHVCIPVNIDETINILLIC
jgi:hypothetical protein